MKEIYIKKLNYNDKMEKVPPVVDQVVPVGLNIIMPKKLFSNSICDSKDSNF